MKMSTVLAPALTLAIGCALIAVPTPSLAQGWHHHRSDEGTWDAIALGAAALGIYGVASHQPGLALAGVVGAGYSLYRASDHDGYYRYGGRDRYYGYGGRDRYYAAPVHRGWYRPDYHRSWSRGHGRRGYF